MGTRPRLSKRLAQSDIGAGTAFKLSNEPFADAGPQQLRVMAKCTTCGAIKTLPKGPIHPDSIHNKIRELGWDISKGGDEATCPKCTKNKRLAKRKEAQDPIIQEEHMGNKAARTFADLVSLVAPTGKESTASSPAPVPEVLVVVSKQPEPRPEPRKGSQTLADANAYLDLHYDSTLCCYLNGGSDEAGAELSGMSVEKFASLREQFYGPLVDYAGLKAEVESKESALQRIEDLIKDLEQSYKEAYNTKDLLHTLSEESKACLLKEIIARRKRVEDAVTKMSEDLDAFVEGAVSKLETRITEALNRTTASLAPQIAQITTSMTALRNDLASIKAKIPV